MANDAKIAAPACSDCGISLKEAGRLKQVPGGWQCDGCNPKKKAQAVTGNEEQKSPEAIRQERHRQKLEALGVKVVEVQLGEGERAMLEQARTARGGLDGPYSVAEYLATLLRRDFALLEQQEGKLHGRICENCRKPLPRGCGGTWASEAACLRVQSDKALQL